MTNTPDTSAPTPEAKNLIFILGAKDPEMNRIEEILDLHKLEFHHTHATPGGADKADLPKSLTSERAQHATFVFVECHVPSLSSQSSVLIDHHNPGDPGYGKGAAQFWEASSLGQLYGLLNKVGIKAQATSEDKILAATDHSFVGAMRGECPGVSGADVMERRVAEIATAQRKPRHVVEATIAHYSSALASLPTQQIGPQIVVKVPDTGAGYTMDYLCAQVAAVKENKAVLIECHNHGDRQTKYHLCGAVQPETLEAFTAKFVPENSLERPYGNPSRSYAGAFAKLENS